MNDLISCVNKAVQQGEISKSAADDIKDFYQRELKDNDIPASEAAIKAIKEAEYKKNRSKYLTALSAKKIAEAEKIVMSHPNGVGHGIASILTKDRKQAMRNSNVEYRAMTILGIAESKFGKVLDNLRTKYGGFHLADDVQKSKNMVREIFKKDTGDAEAKEFAGLWADIAEDLRLQFNAAGGDIRKLEDWGLPQSHNMFKIAKAGRENWIAYIKDKVDLEKMDVGDNVDEFLSHVFDTITTAGLNKLQPGKLPKGVSSARANAHREHRVLIFKDADDWIEYQEKFGQGDVYNALTDHIRGMSNDIALLEILGPNPDRAFEYLLEIAKKEGLSYYRQGHLSAMYNVASGRVDGSKATTKGDFWIEAVLGGVRSITVASKLGSAILSSVVDLGTMSVTAKLNKVGILDTFKSSLKHMTSKEQQLFAVKLGLSSDGWSGSVGTRFAEAGVGKPQQFADFVLRASGLTAWTAGLRKGFGLEFLSMLGEQTSRAFNDLHIDMQDTFKQIGITADDWDLIRSAELSEHGGAKFMSADNIMKLDIPQAKARELSIKLLELTNTEIDYAAISPDARIRALTTWGQPKGTLAGEVSRAVLMFKSFPMAMITTHLSRALNQKTKAGKLAYSAHFFITTAILGAMAVQLKQMAAGKDPKDMTKPKFWGAAISQGGGAGIFGDFLFQDHTRYGNSLIATVFGPVVGMGEDIVKITAGNIQKAFDEKQESDFISDAFNFMYKNAPGQNLWYTRLVFEREIKDQINAIIDGRDFKNKTRRKIRKLKKEEDQEYWWTPGETTPRKAPELSKTIGAE